MEDACLTLEREFKRVCIDLEYSSRSLETQCKSSDENVPDAFALVKRISALQSKLDAVKMKSQTIIDKRKQVTLDTAQSLIRNFNGIRELMIACQCDEYDPSWDNIKDNLELTLQSCPYTRDDFTPSTTVSLPQPSIPFVRNEEQVPPSVTDNETNSEQIVLDDEDEEESVPTDDHNNVSFFQAWEPPVAPALTEEDFNSVPSHVRGRSSLSDLQRVLLKLREGFEKHLQQSAMNSRKMKRGGGRSGGIAAKTKKGGSAGSASGAAISEFSMNLQQLEAAGCKVCGQTGMCVLKSLQRLGYIDLAKRGEVVTLSHAGCDDLIYAHSQQQPSKK